MTYELSPLISTEILITYRPHNCCGNIECNEAGWTNTQLNETLTMFQSVCGDCFQPCVSPSLIIVTDSNSAMHVALLILLECVMMYTDLVIQAHMVTPNVYSLQTKAHSTS